MVEVQDIDALLIGALYGELTPADEARLAAHLESHPTDRTALEQLTHARGLVKPYLSELVEPPQAISALLLQEAVRRAPAKKREASGEDSWFTRFIRSFMAHPAMAAAAMLVVVIGVAGTMYMRKGSDQFAEEKAADTQVALERTLDKSVAAPPPAQAPAAAPVVGGGNAAAGSGSAYGADLAFKDAEGQQGAARGRELDIAKNKVAAAEAKAERAAAHKGIQVKETQSALMPREMAEAPMDDKKADPAPATKQDADQQTRTGAPGGPAMGSVANGAPAAPAPAPAKTVARDGDNNSTNDAGWTKTEHARAIAFVKAGKCDDAAKVAVEISQRDPDYYAANVATDRALKPCMPNITQLRDIESEKMQKARAQKRVNANEPSPAPSDSLK